MSEPPIDPSQFDLFQSRKGKEDGIALALRGSRYWQAEALRIIIDLPVGWKGLGEDFRLVIETRIGPPKNPQAAYGALINTARKRAWIRATGNRRPMRLDSSHARMTDEYIRC